MAEDTRPPASKPIPPAGMNDNSPAGQDAYYQTRGVVISNDLKLQRCNGKKLVGKFNGPVLGISAKLLNTIIVETIYGIYLYTDGDIPTLPV